MAVKPIPFYYDPINRNAIIIRLKKPFFDWVNGLFPDEDPFSEKEENNIYLIHEMDSSEQKLNWIKKNYDGIFINELNDWYTDESKWPAGRTYQMFTEWFDVEVCSMVLDLEDEPIRKD